MTDGEKKPYHNIMTAAWRLFIAERESKQFSDEWWEEIIKDYDKLREPYKGTELDDYVCQINQAFLDELERKMKRGKQNRVSQKVLSGAQRENQRELQCTDPVPEMGRCEEDDVQLTASDW